MTKLAERIVVVVGGSSGIGLGVARAAKERGARVIIVGRNVDKLERARSLLGGNVEAIAVDVTREEDVVRLFEHAPTLDHLVVTAADLRYEPIASVSLDAVRTVLDSKVVAAILLAKHGARCIRAGGSIVYTTGVAAERPAPRGALTAAVNGALDALVRALAIELAPLRVNALSPGWVDTPLWSAIAPADAATPKDAIFAQFAPRLPVRRIGQPEDLGHAAVFLMENDFTTGSTLFVDGGHRLV